MARFHCKMNESVDENTLRKLAATCLSDKQTNKCHLLKCDTSIIFSYASSKALCLIVVVGEVRLNY